MTDNPLKDFLLSQQRFNHKEIEQLLEISREIVIEKDVLIVESGTYSNELYFIKSGFLETYIFPEDSQKKIIFIHSANDFLSGSPFLLSDYVSNVNIQSITKVEAIMIKKSDLIELVENNNNLWSLLYQLHEDLLVKLENQVIIKQGKDSKTKYLELLIKHPEFILNLPLNLLANFLDITPRHLSRIRASLN